MAKINVNVYCRIPWWMMPGVRLAGFLRWRALGIWVFKQGQRRIRTEVR